jgi:hypothetical protein
MHEMTAQFGVAGVALEGFRVDKLCASLTLGGTTMTFMSWVESTGVPRMYHRNFM